jgi:hypothetical protein
MCVSTLLIMNIICEYVINKTEEYIFPPLIFFLWQNLFFERPFLHLSIGILSIFFFPI